MGGFPDKRVDELSKRRRLKRYPVSRLRITVALKCDASVFLVCEMPEFHGQHESALFPVILFAEDVNPDKEL